RRCDFYPAPAQKAFICLTVGEASTEYSVEHPVNIQRKATRISPAQLPGPALSDDQGKHRYEHKCARADPGGQIPGAGAVALPAGGSFAILARKTSRTRRFLC